MLSMKERAKYFLAGILIGIAIGMLAFYFLVNFRIIRPFGFGDFARPENLSNFTRGFNRSLV